MCPGSNRVGVVTCDTAVKRVRTDRFPCGVIIYHAMCSLCSDEFLHVPWVDFLCRGLSPSPSALPLCVPRWSPSTA